MPTLILSGILQYLERNRDQSIVLLVAFDFAVLVLFALLDFFDVVCSNLEAIGNNNFLDLDNGVELEDLMDHVHGHSDGSSSSNEHMRCIDGLIDENVGNICAEVHESRTSTPSRDLEIGNDIVPVMVYFY